MRSITELTDNIMRGGSSAHSFIVEGRSPGARERFIDRLLGELGCHALDLVHMQMSGKKAYKVEDADAFTERLDMGAYGSVLAGIIDEADALSPTVQNKLLKTLEEPRDSVLIFMSLSNRDSLLDTVRSRCSVIRVRDFDEEAADEEEAAAEELKAAARLITENPDFHAFRSAVEGSVRSAADALRLIDLIEDGFRERMLSGEDIAEQAFCIETAERARMDIEKDMDKSKALKRLFLELSGRVQTTDG